MRRNGKLTDDTQEEIYSQEVKWWLPGAQGNGKLLFNGYKISVWEDEISGDWGWWWLNNMNALYDIGLCTYS